MEIEDRVRDVEEAVRTHSRDIEAMKKSREDLVPRFLRVEDIVLRIGESVRDLTKEVTQLTEAVIAQKAVNASVAELVVEVRDLTKQAAADRTIRRIAMQVAGWIFGILAAVVASYTISHLPQKAASAPTARSQPGKQP